MGCDRGSNAIQTGTSSENLEEHGEVTSARIETRIHVVIENGAKRETYVHVHSIIETDLQVSLPQQYFFVRRIPSRQENWSLTLAILPKQLTERPRTIRTCIWRDGYPEARAATVEGRSPKLVVGRIQAVWRILVPVGHYTGRRRAPVAPSDLGCCRHAKGCHDLSLRRRSIGVAGGRVQHRIDPGRRPGTLDLIDFARLAAILSDRDGKGSLSLGGN